MFSKRHHSFIIQNVPYVSSFFAIFFLPQFPQMVFYIQDSDDVYGLFRFDPAKEQNIQSQPEGRFLSLNFLRSGGTLGNVSMAFGALYIPAGPIDPARARDHVLNVSGTINVVFARQRMVHIILPIRNDAFLQNGAHFLIQVIPLKQGNLSCNSAATFHIHITKCIPSVSVCTSGQIGTIQGLSASFGCVNGFTLALKSGMLLWDLPSCPN